MCQSSPKISFPIPATKAIAAIAGTLEREPEGDERERQREDRERRGEEHPSRPEAQPDQAPGDEARRPAGEDQPPRRGAAKLIVRDDGPEHAERAQDDHQHERELEHDRPEPRPRAELAPADAELVEEVRRLLAHDRGQPHQRDAAGRHEVGARVDGDRPARPDARDEEPRHRGAADHRRVHRQLEQRVRLLQERRRDRLRDDTRRGGEEERGRAAVHCCERGQVPDLGVARDHERGRVACANALTTFAPIITLLRGIRSAQIPPTSRKTTSGTSRQKRIEAEVGLRAGQVEDGERERDGCDRAADEGDRAAGEEEAELALAQRRGAPPHSRVSQ